MRLAVDNENVSNLPVGNYQDIAAMARSFADEVDAKEYGDVIRTILVVEKSDGFTMLSWGDYASSFELMGILDSAKLRVFADDIAQ